MSVATQIPGGVMESVAKIQEFFKKNPSRLQASEPARCKAEHAFWIRRAKPGEIVMTRIFYLLFGAGIIALTAIAPEPATAQGQKKGQDTTGVIIVDMDPTEGARQIGRPKFEGYRARPAPGNPAPTGRPWAQEVWDSNVTGGGGGGGGGGGR
jgi:hypothetical protein